MSYQCTRDEFQIRTDPLTFDVRAIHTYLTRSYWAAGISYELVIQSIAHSLCFGMFDGERQIGFARVITDRATYAYLADVYILNAYQGRGLGKWLIASVVAHPDLQGLRRWSLVTRDAHGLYAQFGFQPVEGSAGYMERRDILSYLD